MSMYNNVYKFVAPCTKILPAMQHPKMVISQSIQSLIYQQMLMIKALHTRNAHTHTYMHAQYMLQLTCQSAYYYLTSAAVVSFNQSPVDTNGVLSESESVGTTNIILVLSKPVDQDATITVRTTDVTATGEIMTSDITQFYSFLYYSW